MKEASADSDGEEMVTVGRRSDVKGVNKGG